MRIFLRVLFFSLVSALLMSCVHNDQSEEANHTQATSNGPEGQVITVTPPEAGSGQVPNQNPATNSAARTINPALPQ